MDASPKGDTLQQPGTLSCSKEPAILTPKAVPKSAGTSHTHHDAQSSGWFVMPCMSLACTQRTAFALPHPCGLHAPTCKGIQHGMHCTAGIYALQDPSLLVHMVQKLQMHLTLSASHGMICFTCFIALALGICSAFLNAARLGSVCNPPRTACCL